MREVSRFIEIKQKTSQFLTARFGDEQVNAAAIPIQNHQMAAKPSVTRVSGVGRSFTHISILCGEKKKGGKYRFSI